MSAWQTLATLLGSIGLTAAGTAAVVWMILRSAISTHIEGAVKHHFSKLLEMQKTENAIIQEKLKKAMELCGELKLLHQELVLASEDFEKDGGPRYFENLLTNFHPKYRRRFQNIRSGFELTNHLLSSYSLMFDEILHTNCMREIIDQLEVKSRGNVRFIYTKTWLTIVECTNCLVRDCTGYSYWDPRKNYGERADRWARFDKSGIIKFLGGAAHARGAQLQGLPPAPFYLSIEEENGPTRFWDEYPTLDEAAQPAPRNFVP
jgi:hypothetical protein